MPQQQHASYIEEINVTDKANDQLIEDEATMHRGAIGNIQWIGNSDRPDIATGAFLMVQKISICAVPDPRDLSKVYQDMKKRLCIIKLAPLINNLEAVTHSYSASGNRNDGASRMGCYAAVKRSQSVTE